MSLSIQNRLNNSAQKIRALAKERILLLDGATGTMIQSHKLKEADYRGSQFADWTRDLKGDNDLLCLTRPALMQSIHEDFLAAGSDIITTNSFNGTSISQSDYGMEAQVEAINLAAARIARKAADEWTAKTPDKPRFVAGSIGPTNKTLSVSPRVNEPGYRDVTFDQMKDVYKQQASALLEGGVDLLLIETIFDTLNAKAALVAVDELSQSHDVHIPIILAVTITDLSGRNLSGQTVEAFWYSVRHARPLAAGMNCSFGADQLRPHVLALSKIVETLICVYPNAGLPNDMGDYDESPAHTAGSLEGFARDGLVNIVGGCCGTTPDHIRAIAKAIADQKPRIPPSPAPKLRLAGLEPMVA
ncbi:methionine synthase [alpha proteobacterium Q-1]|nr:methionine synthase [alpha proteobacterium Q-1]